MVQIFRVNHTSIKQSQKGAERDRERDREKERQRETERELLEVSDKYPHYKYSH